jgi:hypothetical protein
MVEAVSPGTGTRSTARIVFAKSQIAGDRQVAAMVSAFVSRIASITNLPVESKTATEIVA